MKRRTIPGSTAFVPSTAGLILAGEVINDLAEMEKDKQERLEGVPL
jgi:tRNA A37 threonylcarbamoyladenosine dehydratase